MIIVSLNGNGSIYKDNETVSIQGYGDGYNIDASTNMLLSENIQTVIYFCSKDGVTLPPIPEEFLFIPTNEILPTTTPLFIDPTQVTFKFAIDDIVNLVTPPVILEQSISQGFKITNSYISIKDNYYIPVYEVQITLDNVPHTFRDIEEVLIYQ